MANLKTFHSVISQTILPLANLLSLIFGVTYIFNSGGSILWNLYGLLLILTLLGNLTQILTTAAGRKLDYLYLVWFTASMLIVPVANTIASGNVTDMDSRSYISYVLLLSTFLLGEIMSGTRLIAVKPAFPGNPETLNKGKEIMRMVLIALLLLSFIIGSYVPYELLSRDQGGLMEVFIPEYSFFLGMFFLGAACLIIRLNHKKRKSVLNRIVFVTGLLFFILCSLPMASVPKMLDASEKAYTDAFGSANEALKDLGNTSFDYRAIPFSIPEYFFGSPSNSFTVQENVLFYEGTDGVDKGIKLYFDTYAPVPYKSGKPSKSPVLLRIHGGAWTVGDKGAFNFAQVNKYFASRGYVVFDIQYGLFNGKKYVEMVDRPENVLGDFSVDDMVRHIGLFTQYLADHQDEYNADPDSVFISGGSAGGQLTLAAGLAITGGKYRDIMDDRLKIKGIIPFYPANGLTDNFGIQGTDELSDPALLVTENSPPCLIYQGTHDGIVDSVIAEQCREAYLRKGNSRCALLSMPFGSHASDFYYSGYYNQVFIYYMERFMKHFQ